ncbi:CoA pyrophosphatase [Mucilaginibacter conchicola]|uniref:CoA pyrophosphatase n=1 Tax=Mucilaginibacter conchicola TaxID=2303333 RepID=A0A372P0M2_9SPHI|nr:CoA pyrophosphatase [Mucilaginibacter conchicola]RFZ95822.1 CoA pyrophosphatase [Mucilaginibacter conchicola]
MAAGTSFSCFIEQLAEGLKKPLPGEAAHPEMEAMAAKYLGVLPDENTRKSAVLMLLYPCAGKICFPLILRRSYSGFHSGEVSFPGGKYELGDNDLIQTALREANEEIGLVASDVRILGTLTEVFIGPSNFMMLPVLGYIPYRPNFVPDTREVEQIFEVDLEHFAAFGAVSISEISIPGDQVLTPHYSLDGHKVWGATAKAINELLSVAAAKKNQY